jgi:hypothetical protein
VIRDLAGRLAFRALTGGLDLAGAAMDRASRVAGKGVYWAGRCYGAAEQIRDAVHVLALPLEFPAVRWRKSARWAWRTLRGADARPIIKMLRFARSVRKEVVAAALDGDLTPTGVPDYDRN